MSHHHGEPDAEGWYDDPEGHKGIERYWNGTEWSGAPRHKPPTLTWGAIAGMLIGTVVLAGLAWWIFFA